jgi:hypothetical protein
MRNTLSLKAVGQATSLFFAISFVLCIAVSLIFPAHTMAQSLRQLLPGFQWLTFKGFFLGLIEAYGYGWYATLIWVPIYNVSARHRRPHAA